MENEQETKAREEVTIPVLSMDHKLKLLLAQRDALSAKVIFDSAQRTYQDKMRIVNDTAAGIAKDLDIDPSKWVINMDDITLEPAQK